MSSIGTLKGILEIAKFALYVTLPIDLMYTLANDSEKMKKLIQKANALRGLVGLLHEEVAETAYEALQTLSTLVRADSPQRGANVLHEADAIKPTLDILHWGPGYLKGEALKLLEKIFRVGEMVEKYGSVARFRLLDITGRINSHEEVHLKTMATSLLAILERNSGFDTSSLPLGLNG